MPGMQHQQIEVCLMRPTRRRDELLPYLIHAKAIQREWRLAAWRVGQRRGRDEGPVALAQRAVYSHSRRACRATAAGMPEHTGELRGGMRMERVHDGEPRGGVLGQIHPQVLR